MMTSPAPYGLRSERVLVDGSLRSTVVVVSGGRIDALLPGDAQPDGLPVRDLGTDVLMPGIVDTHVHVNEPGRTQWEGFRTATRAAAAGGITTLVDMPLNCIPATTDARSLAEKLGACREALWVDCGFWGGVVPGNAGDLPALLEAGALGCKAFMIDSGVAEFPAASLDDLRLAMPVLAAHGVPLLVHAEMDVSRPELGGLDPTAYGTYVASRPPEWEEAAVEAILQLGEDTGCWVHVVHLSAASCLPSIEAARNAGASVTVETCPHYLVLSAEEVEAGRTDFKCAPPVRSSSNREELWRGLGAGDIDSVVSDHSPCTPGLKRLESGDFLEAWGGIASLQLALPLVWTEARRRGAGIGDVSRWMSRRTAELAGVDRRKGRIAKGFDADLVAWDPDSEFTVDPVELHHRHAICPYGGRRLTGVVRRTWLRGNLVYEDGRVADAPVGRPILGRT